MANYEPNESQQRVDRNREHARGLHEHCLYDRCRDRREIEYACEETMFVKAIFAYLKRIGVSAREFFGDGLDEARATAGRNHPDWITEYVVGDNLLIPIRAQTEVRISLAKRAKVF